MVAPAPEYDTAAEQALIGSCLLTPSAIIAARELGVEAPMFIGKDHGTMWQAIVDLANTDQPVDPVTVASRMAHYDDRTPWAPILIGYLSDGGYSSRNAATYATAVRDAWRERHITFELQACLNGARPNWRTRFEQLAAEVDSWYTDTEDQYLELDTFLDVDEPDHDWIIPGLIETGDRVIITARSGTGKSTLLRQIGVMAASGLHPFTAEPIDHSCVLYLDTENSERQIRREIRPLREAAGDYWGEFHLRVYGHAINLADPATATELCRTIDRLTPQIILLGPLYKLGEGDPKDEQVAKAVADTLDRIRGIHGSALIIEAHSPYPTAGTKPTIRPYGASLWERWPEFGWHLAADGKTEHWRGQREERQWPTKLERGTPWPWTPANTDEAEHEPWNGPTHCIAAITHYLTTHPDEELSARQLETALRAAGNGYRHDTVREAAERAAQTGQINVRKGPRNASLYTHTNTPKLDTDNAQF